MSHACVRKLISTYVINLLTYVLEFKLARAENLMMPRVPATKDDFVVLQNHWRGYFWTLSKSPQKEGRQSERRCVTKITNLVWS